MKTSLDEFVSAIDRLTSRLDDLEGRIAALEQASASPAIAKRESARDDSAQELHLEPRRRPLGVMAVVGRVFLGIAGAYVLRAVAETSLFPHWAILAVAFVYAGMWLVWAARTSDEAVFAGTAYATTAAVILSPMLWELTLRFKVMSSAATAAMLVLFVAVSAGLAWRRRLAAVICPPAAFAALTAAALLVATRDPVPFSVALLAMALLTEVAAGSNRWLSLRPVVAVAADFAVLALILIYTGDRVGFDYRPIGPGTLLVLFAALLAVYVTSLLGRTAVQGHEVKFFEAVQLVVAFALVLWGMLRAAPQMGAGVGAFCLVVSASCYVLAFFRFDGGGQRRNHRVFGAWAIALFLAGSFLSFSRDTASVWLGLAAVAVTLAGARSGRLSLELHGAMYLSGAAAASGLLRHAARLLVGDLPLSARWPVWVAGASALVSYGVVRRLGRPLRKQEPKWPEQALQVAFAFLCAYAAMAATVAAALLALPAITAARLAGLRTLVICLSAVLMGWIGARLRHSELIWLAYAAIAFCSLKLIFEDLRLGNTGTLAFSLFCCGMVWLLVPKFARGIKTD
jgi:hypothetical protein